MTESEQVILYIDDDNDSCEMVKVMFRLAGNKITTRTTAIEGLRCARKDGFAAIILDNRFNDSTGVEICREMRSFDNLTPVIFFTAEARTSEKRKALEAGANAYLVKPNDLEILTETVLGFIDGTQQN